MTTLTEPHLNTRFGAAISNSNLMPVDRKMLEKSLKRVQSKSGLEDLLKNLKVDSISVAPIEVEVLKKPRGLTPDEKIKMLEAQGRTFSDWVKSLKTPIHAYMSSPTWEGVKSGHYTGILGGAFAGLTAEAVKNYQPIYAQLGNALIWLGKHAPGFSKPMESVSFIENAGHFGGHPGAVLTATALGALGFGVPAAIAGYFGKQKENQDFETLMQVYPEGATKWNMLTDSRIKNLIGDWGGNLTDGNLERRLASVFNRSADSPVPSNFLPKAPGWAFPWNFLPILTAPLKDVPLAKNLHEALVSAQKDGLTPAMIPGLSQVTYQPARELTQPIIDPVLKGVGVGISTAATAGVAGVTGAVAGLAVATTQKTTTGVTNVVKKVIGRNTAPSDESPSVAPPPSTPLSNRLAGRSSS
jgi:hypothetical protein